MCICVLKHGITLFILLAKPAHSDPIQYNSFLINTVFMKLLMVTFLTLVETFGLKSMEFISTVVSGGFGLHYKL